MTSTKPDYCRVSICFALVFGLTTSCASASQAAATTPAREKVGTPPVGVLRGTVIDQNGKPIDGAAIAVTSPSMQGVRAELTDNAGTYLFKGLPTGPFDVLLFYAGIQATRTGVAVGPNRTASVGFVVDVRGVELLQVLNNGSQVEAIVAGRACYSPQHQAYVADCRRTTSLVSPTLNTGITEEYSRTVPPTIPPFSPCNLTADTRERETSLLGNLTFTTPPPLVVTRPASWLCGGLLDRKPLLARCAPGAARSLRDLCLHQQ